MNQTEQKQMMINNLNAKIKARAAILKEAKIHETADGFTYTDAHLPSYNFNVVTLPETGYPLNHSTFKEIIDYFNSRKYPINVWCWNRQKDVISLFKETGLNDYGTDYLGMIADLGDFQPIASNVDADFHFQKAASPEQFITFGNILSSLYTGTNEEKQIQTYFEKAAQSILLEDNNFQHIIGYHQGRPAAIGSIFFSDGIAGLYDIATLKGARGNGLGTKLTSHLLSTAKAEDAAYCTLQASPEAENIYQRLGFDTFDKLKVFVNFE
ncbi:GNAT family N-acetyltransferase [Oceanobacillus neutriphilus]|uniref:N-acetyltransferase n=1 Tax=Oceanobacillus neutriphilus TaxID=531815 RepID=A0ABQ2NW69_9BACI|nr:GNAT family N-acetyltransferase [Oceanobacillus neutriphilus]GGP12122.1 N-acetyltransferase [Oceanobacillus neutriphilus]